MVEKKKKVHGTGLWTLTLRISLLGKTNDKPSYKPAHVRGPAIGVERRGP